MIARLILILTAVGFVAAAFAGGPTSQPTSASASSQPAGGGAATQPTSPPALKRGDWPMWGGRPDRNMTSDERNIPAEWNLKNQKNVKWTAKLGSQTYGSAVVAGGRVYVGTNNGGGLRPGIEGDKGVLVCLDEKTGKFLWQATHDKLPTGAVNDWPEQGIVSAPLVCGDRLWYVSNRCEVVCADVNGMADGNAGPFTQEKYAGPQDADFVWVYDMIGALGVFPHNLATSSPVAYEGMLFVGTSNGVDDSHTNLPSPEAPSLIALDMRTGKLRWKANEPGKNILHGQWSSPAFGVVKGRPLAFFGAGDGWCYAYEAKSGKLVWKFDLNPKEAKWVVGGSGTRSSIIATPVFYDDKVFLSVGQDPEHGAGAGHLYCIDATKHGDVTKSGRIWHVGGEAFQRSLSTVAIRDGLVYASDLMGYLHCLDEKTGKEYWVHDTFAAIWGSPMVVDGKVYIGTQDGEVLVFEHGKTLKLLATNDLMRSVYCAPVAANGVLYITHRNGLVAIAGG